MSLELRLLLQFPEFRPRARHRTMVTTMSTSDTTKKLIHTLVLRDRFSQPMDRGTSSFQAAATSAGLNSTRQKNAGNVLHDRSVRYQKRKGLFSEASMQNTTKETKNTHEKEHLYKSRQAIVEHPYGTIKRQWGFSYVLTKKGICRAGSDVGFMFIAYNLRRIGNILTMNVLKDYLKILATLFLTVLDFFRRKISRFWTPFFGEIICANEKQPSLKSL